MKTARILRDNRSSNKLFPVLDLFLQRQLHLKGSIGVIESADSKWEIMNQGIVLNDNNPDAFFYEDLFKYEKSNAGHVFLIKSYVRNCLIAQSVDSFESFVKELFDTVVETQFQGVKFKKKNVFQFTKEYIRFLLEFALPYRIPNEQKSIETFEMAEKVRHVIVHNDHVLKLGSIPQNLKTKFDEYFEIESNRLMVDHRGAEVLIAQIAQIGFDVFKVLSEKYSWPVDIR